MDLDETCASHRWIPVLPAAPDAAGRWNALAGKRFALTKAAPPMAPAEQFVELIAPPNAATSRASLDVAAVPRAYER
jgi:hypothetical protein